MVCDISETLQAPQGGGVQRLVLRTKKYLKIGIGWRGMRQHEATMYQQKISFNYYYLYYM